MCDAQQGTGVSKWNTRTHCLLKLGGASHTWGCSRARVCMSRRMCTLHSAQMPVVELQRRSLLLEVGSATGAVVRMTAMTSATPPSLAIRHTS